MLVIKLFSINILSGIITVHSAIVSCVINRIMYSELVIIAHKPWQGEWRPQQDYPCTVNMSKCRGLCSCQYILASDSKLYSSGASCARAALHHVKKQTGVLLHGLTEIICLPSGISSTLSTKCWWCSWALTALWCCVFELCFRFHPHLILYYW